MKLWQKAGAISIAVLVAVVSVCSGLLFTRSKNTILDFAHEQTKIKQQNLATSFAEMTSLYLAAADSDAVKDTLVNYCFTRFADSSAVLICNGSVLYTQLNFSPQEYLQIDGSAEGAQTFDGVINNRNVLIAGSGVSVRNDKYYIYVAEDISSVYSQIAKTAWLFVVVSAAGVLLGTGAIFLLMRRTTRPITQLASAARQIAGGHYEMRTDIKPGDEIGELAADFNLMADTVEAHIATLTETAERQRLFIGGVTHEFKTPLTALLLHSRMLRRANMTDDEKDASLEHIETQCQWLERLVQSLLRLITLEDTIELTRVPVAALFERVAESTAKTLSDRQVRLVTSRDTECLTLNKDLMQSLLINLVDNAAKAYDGDYADKTVTLSAYGNTLEVKDTGRGIPQASITRVLEPFYMVDKSRSKKSGGSGLGLALVKRIADAHGAELEIDSAPGAGTVVRVRLQKDYN